MCIWSELSSSEYIIFLSLIKDLEKQEELRIAHKHLKEHKEIIDELRRIVSDKTNEISNMQMDLENKNSALKAQVFLLSCYLSNSFNQVFCVVKQDMN